MSTQTEFHNAKSGADASDESNLRISINDESNSHKRAEKQQKHLSIKKPIIQSSTDNHLEDE